MDNIEKIIYINLEHRKDRRAHIESELLKFFPKEKIIRLNATYHDNGHLGCAISHITAIQYAIENKLQNVLIVEDDFTFNVDKEVLGEKIKYLFEREFNICLFGANIQKARKLDPHLCEIIEASTASCYLVNSFFFEKLFETFKEAVKLLSKTGNHRRYAIDQHWKQLQGINSNFLVFFPSLGYQQPSYSDIEKKFVAYNC